MSDDIRPSRSVRPPLNRAPPVTLEDHLSRAYAARFRLDGSDSENPDVCAQRLAAAGIPKAQLTAQRNELRLVEGRCTVSKTHREVIDAALALMP